MKVSLFLLTFLVLLTGCDAPRRSRLPVKYVNGSTLEEPGTISGTWTPTTAGATSGVTSGTAGGSGFESCDLSNKYQTIDIGWFGLCQSSQDESEFRFKPTLTSTNVRTCLIPTYKDTNGNSTYIGRPQCTYTTSNQTVNGKLYKDRQGYTTYPINGVIVMKEPLIPEYINCMHGYTNWPGNACPNGASNQYCGYWLPRCPSGRMTNGLCDNEAKNYMGRVCTEFKNKYSNSYRDISTR
jgi:hypothetical protein